MSGVFANGVVSKTDLVRFEARVPRPAYRRTLPTMAGTPDILMLPNKGDLLIKGDEGPAQLVGLGHGALHRR
jgi:hypothetical protein